jgi:lysyl-tRNA synthetase class 2
MPSSVICDFHYDPAERRLDIRFVSGRRYRYCDVPVEVAVAMRDARSKGAYFSRFIRDCYRFMGARGKSG